MDNLTFLFLECQKGDKVALENATNQFYPLIRKHSLRLFSEDAFEELQCFFLELITSEHFGMQLEKLTKGQVLSYIKRSIINYCNNLAKKEKYQRSFLTTISTRNNEEDRTFENTISCQHSKKSFDDMETLESIRMVLPEIEYQIVVLNYLKGKTEKEIAEELGVTQSAVNQRKKSALGKIEKLYEF